jgi:hypothetical protein
MPCPALPCLVTQFPPDVTRRNLERHLPISHTLGAPGHVARLSLQQPAPCTLHQISPQTHIPSPIQKPALCRCSPLSAGVDAPKAGAMGSGRLDRDRRPANIPVVAVMRHMLIFPALSSSVNGLRRRATRAPQTRCDGRWLWLSPPRDRDELQVSTKRLAHWAIRSGSRCRELALFGRAARYRANRRSMHSHLLPPHLEAIAWLLSPLQLRDSIWHDIATHLR